MGTVEDTETTVSDEVSRSHGLSFAFSESFTQELKDAVERRSSGLIQDGKTFFTAFRAFRNVRIAGAYSFDLMLEVPATISSQGNIFVSEPVAREVRADILLLGVVRHVWKRGQVGIFHRVPESENDHTYDQVVLRVLSDRLLWKAAGEPWIDVQSQKHPHCSLQIVTNHEEARAVVYDRTGKIIAKGKGEDMQLELPPNKECPGSAGTGE